MRSVCSGMPHDSHCIAGQRISPYGPDGNFGFFTNNRYTRLQLQRSFHPADYSPYYEKIPDQQYWREPEANVSYESRHAWSDTTPARPGARPWNRADRREQSSTAGIGCLSRSRLLRRRPERGQLSPMANGMGAHIESGDRDMRIEIAANRDLRQHSSGCRMGTGFRPAERRTEPPANITGGPVD